MIVLASGSWLRKTVLESSKLDFIVKIPDVDERGLERSHPNATPQELVAILAQAKASVVHRDSPNDLVIAADTLAVLPDGTWLHKPASHEEAIELSLRQSGKTVQAITGLAITFRDEQIIRTTTTDITYMQFNKDTIERLLEGDDPAIRNSGLGFFSDAPGFTLVKEFKGSYTGAMGLPMEHVWDSLARLGYMTTGSNSV